MTGDEYRASLSDGRETFFEGEAIEGQLDLAGRLFDFRPGDTVQLEVMRDARLITINMLLGRQG